jgi:dephospho-CoA kinase
MIISLTGKKQSGKDTVATIIRTLIYCSIADKELTEENYASLSQCNVSNFENKKFAGKLKKCAALMLGCSITDMESEEFKETVLGEEWWYWTDDKNIIPYGEEVPEEYKLVMMTPRIFLQRLATDAVRNNLHPNAWINSTVCDYTPKKIWVVSDTRFHNEIQAIRNTDVSSVLIKVVRKKTFEEWVSEFKERFGIVAVCIDNDNTKVDLQTAFNKFEHFCDWYELTQEFYKFKRTFDHKSETELDSFEDWNFVIENDGSLGDLISKVRMILKEIKLIN